VCISVGLARAQDYVVHTEIEQRDK